MKFKRVVYAEITPKKTGETFIAQGLRIKFNVNKTIEAALNSGTIEIYNLNPKHRAALVFKYNLHNNASADLYGGTITLYAGYEGNAKMLFKGDIVSASSIRNGGDYITRIQAQTLAQTLLSKNVSKTFPRGTSYKSILDYVIKELNLPGIKAEMKVYLLQLTGGLTLKSGETVEGSGLSILDMINKRFKGKISLNVDEVGLNVYGPGISAIPLPKFFFSKYSGLIGPPSITNQGANLKVLLEPTVRISDVVLLVSATVEGDIEPLFVVKSINHTGDSREGEFVTNLTCWYQTAASTIKVAL